MDAKQKTKKTAILFLLLIVFLIAGWVYLNNENPKNTKQEEIDNIKGDTETTEQQEDPIGFNAEELPYDQILLYTIVNGRFVYSASKDHKTVIVDGTEEIGREYDSIGSLKEVAGKIAYAARKNGKSFIVYDGKRSVGNMNR